MSDDCLFCGIVAGDVPAQIVDSDENTVAFMDISPATRGHVLVIPRNHAENVLDVSEEDMRNTYAAAQRLVHRIDDVLEPDGFNVLNSCKPAAWQTVFHFHVHVVPRFEDDPLELPWVPSPGDADEIARTAVEIKGEG